MARDEEKKFIADGIASVERITGQRPVGWNAHAVRNSISTLEIPRELNFVYFIDDLSRDEPSIIPLPKGEIAPYPTQPISTICITCSMSTISRSSNCC